MIRSLTQLFLVFLMAHNLFGQDKKTISNPVKKIVLDTDMGSDCDDVGALALLNEYANSGKAEILGVVYSSGAVPYGIGIIDAINRYYGNDSIPIGASYDTEFGDPVDKMQAEKLAQDTIAFKNRVIYNTDVPEQTTFLRKLLAQQEDNSVSYVTIGHTKALHDLLVSQPDTISHLSGMDLAKKKLSCWIALGALKADNEDGHYTKDWNFFFNGTAPYTHYLVENFPKPVFFISGGSDVMTGESLIHTPNGNIVRTAYRDWLWNVEQKKLADQRPSWDLLAVYFAVEDQKKYFNISTKGYLHFDADKGCKWTETNTGTNHHFVSLKSGVTVLFANELNTLIAKRGHAP
ncbi:hypothetical protein [Ulvibacterium sp.]|uniref:hypothetical protein n=1 Tax=Ulvibacterium sp. TaxID=2665914 RepID=UPI00260B2FCF|nr:hypothetical protein [Ulvibacterium sp.]